ncbi:dienelactone hydrolase [Catenulispora sp. GP43]|uniref:alpha/beta hydrolase n=1 Tax=Catenulispora sp. GP43 TaxID=3156263 RepID=UPI003517954E
MSREPEPRLDPPTTALSAPVIGAVLLAHGGKEISHQAPHRRGGPVTRMRMIARAVAPRLAGHGIAVHTMCFRYQGWNGDERAPVADVHWAAARLAEQYGDVPLLLGGHSLGGRAVVNAADAPGVAGVLGLAPWLPGEEPTAQLAGRRLLLAHGTRDHVTSPRSSFEYAARARAEGHDVARIVLPGSGHTLLSRARDWNRLVLAFSHTCLLDHHGAADPAGARPPRYTDVIAEAFKAAAPEGLQRVLTTAGRVRA